MGGLSPPVASWNHLASGVPHWALDRYLGDHPFPGVRRTETLEGPRGTGGRKLPQ